MPQLGAASQALGLVSTSIASFDACLTLFEAAQDAMGMTAEFKTVAEQLPLVLYGLESVQDGLEVSVASEQAAAALQSCKKEAETMQHIFEEVLPSKDTETSECYKKARKFKIKSSTVRTSMELVLKDIFMLADIVQVVGDAGLRKGLQDALEKISTLGRNTGSQFSNSTETGSFNINSGAGSQTNHNNTGEGTQNVAHTMHIGKGNQ